MQSLSLLPFRIAVLAALLLQSPILLNARTWTDTSGRKLRISLKGAATAQVLSLSRLLWRSEP